MKVKTTVLFLMLAMPLPGMSKWSDKSDLETVEVALCTAAIMKAGMGIEPYRKWAAALNKRYSQIYEAKSATEIDKYTSERIVDKRAELQRKGVITTAAFRSFYETNCKNHHP